MTSPTRPLPAAMIPFLGLFRLVLRRVKLHTGFVLQPVEVPGPDVALVLADFLTGEGCPATIVEPRNDETAWRELPARLVAAKPREADGVVVMVGGDPLPGAAIAGLHLLNQRRNTLVEDLGCALLWCGPRSFLNLCWEEAPDFWSIRAIDLRHSEATPAPTDAFLATLDEVSGSGNESGHGSGYGSGHGYEQTLQQAAEAHRRGRTLEAAVTLGALLASPEASSNIRLRAQLLLGRVLEDGHDLPGAEAAYREALAFARQQGDLESEARALLGAYGIAARTGRAADAEGPLAEARAIAARLGDQNLESTLAAAQALASIGGFDARKGEMRIEEARGLRDLEQNLDRDRDEVVRVLAPLDFVGQRLGRLNRHAREGTYEGRVDALIVTALQDELAAVLALGDGWQETRDLSGFRYYRRAFPSERGGSITIAAAWLGEMGERTAAIRGQQLIAELNPVCLSMCGICAGDRRRVALGDVIIADCLYSYDHGKLIAEPGKEIDFRHDIRTFDLQATWKMDAAYLAAEIDLAALSRSRPPSSTAQQRWLLHTLFAHETEGTPSPQAHPDRRDACPSWTSQVKEALRLGLVTVSAGKIALTAEGRERVLGEQVIYPDGLPGDPPLRVHVGAIATGKTVRQDPELFIRLERVVRTTLGVEMEGAAVGELAVRSGKPAIVVKAVSDHADLDKDDSFRAFACKASAEVLVAFLKKHVEPGARERTEVSREPSGRIHTPMERDGGRIGPGDGAVYRNTMLARVERIAKLRNPGATITQLSAPAPFAGLLEVEVRGGSLVDLRVIGALDQPVTEALVSQYVTEVELAYRRENPSLSSTLVHGGEQAPLELSRAARRRGITLTTFVEYQGLIDFSRYLDWQTKALESDIVYPPWLYVEQPARVSLAQGREEQATEHALATLWDLLESPHPRFALVLGDFGAGKTFLLHELARRMAKDKHPLTPVLVEMSRLEKQRDLKVLLAQHFARADMGRFDPNAFLYMLSEGRIALLFDGFDELALRLTYDRALEHFETVMAAAQGNAKVVVTSRTQHFLTDQEVRLELGKRAEQVTGFRLLKLEKFGEKQIQRFLGNLIAEPREADEWYALLHDVKDLLGLSENPRMLGFIAKIDPEKLRKAKKGGEITAAKLYEILIGQWLEHEHARANPPGAPKGLTQEKLGELVTALAGVFWAQNASKGLLLGDFSGVLVAEGIAPDVVEHMIGSGSLLVRDAEGRFSFVHRSVMEWLVARTAAEDLKEKGDAALLAADEMSALMADFLICLAGRERAERWAWGAVAQSADGHTKKNAAQVLKRIEVLAGGAERSAVEIPVTVDLEGEDLRGQDWSRVDWQGANLTRVNLEGATLREADLRGAELVDAKLRRADLEKAKLSGANIAGADLAFARLMGADLTDAAGLTAGQLRGAKLVGAQGGPVEGLIEAGGAPQTPSEIPPMTTQESECWAVAWNEAGDLVASGHEDGSIRLWDVVTGQALRVLSEHKGAIQSVAFSPDGRNLASGSSDNTVRLWDVASGRLVRASEGHTNGVTSVAFSPDGRTFASGSSDKTVRLWDVASGRLVRAFRGHTNWVSSVAFSPDGRTLASGSLDNTVRLWDVASGRLVRASEGHTNGVTSVAFSPDGRTLASGSSDNTVCLRDVASGRLVRAFRGHTNWVSSVAFSPDGRTLASGSYDNIVRLWDVASGRLVRALEGHTNWVRSVAFSPDGRTLASGSSDHTVRLWNVASGRLVRALEGHTTWILSVAFSPDGRALASGSPDKTVRLWDVASGRLVRASEGHTNWVRSVAFSPDGRTLASGSSDKTVRLWDVASGRLVRALEGHTNGVLSVAFSPDGRTLASGSSDNTVRLWDVASGRLVCASEGHAKWVWSVAFSPDGRTLASGSLDKTVRLWDVASGRLVRASEGHTKRVLSVAFSPDGRTLASGSSDKTVRLWDVASGRLVRASEGHTNWILSVAFSPDGRILASGSLDNTVRLWDVASGRCLVILLPGPEGWAAFTPDGRYKLGGDIAGAFWHVIGLCRFEPGELDEYIPGLRIPEDVPLLTLSPPERTEP